LLILSKVTGKLKLGISGYALKVHFSLGLPTSLKRCQATNAAYQALDHRPACPEHKLQRSTSKLRSHTNGKTFINIYYAVTLTSLTSCLKSSSNQRVSKQASQVFLRRSCSPCANYSRGIMASTSCACPKNSICTKKASNSNKNCPATEIASNS
jgi:hypothetical protein